MKKLFIGMMVIALVVFTHGSSLAGKLYIESNTDPGTAYQGFYADYYYEIFSTDTHKECLKIYKEIKKTYTAYMKFKKTLPKKGKLSYSKKVQLRRFMKTFISQTDALDKYYRIDNNKKGWSKKGLKNLKYNDKPFRVIYRHETKLYAFYKKRKKDFDKLGKIFKDKRNTQIILEEKINNFNKIYFELSMDILKVKPRAKIRNEKVKPTIKWLKEKQFIYIDSIKNLDDAEELIRRLKPWKKEHDEDNYTLQRAKETIESLIKNSQRNIKKGKVSIHDFIIPMCNTLLKKCNAVYKIQTKYDIKLWGLYEFHELKLERHYRKNRN